MLRRRPTSTLEGLLAGPTAREAQPALRSPLRLRSGRPFARRLTPRSSLCQASRRKPASKSKQHPVHASASSRGEHRSRRSKGRRRPGPQTSLAGLPTIDDTASSVDMATTSWHPLKLRLSAVAPSRANLRPQFVAPSVRTRSAAHEQPDSDDVRQPVIMLATYHGIDTLDSLGGRCGAEHDAEWYWAPVGGAAGARHSVCPNEMPNAFSAIAIPCLSMVKGD